MITLTEIKEHLKSNRVPYIIGTLLFLSSSLFLVIWQRWLYELLARHGQVVPRQVLGAIIGVLLLWLLALMVIVVLYARTLKQVQTQTPELHAKIENLETRRNDLETENGLLKQKIGNSTVEIETLKTQIEKLSHWEVDETDIAILRVIADAKYAPPWAEFLADLFDSHVEAIRHRLNKLVKHHYLRSWHDAETQLEVFGLHYNGRDYLVKNKLI